MITWFQDGRVARMIVLHDDGMIYDTSGKTPNAAPPLRRRSLHLSVGLEVCKYQKTMLYKAGKPILGKADMQVLDSDAS